MARPSSIKRLPPEVREVVGDLRDQGHTIDEILEHLRQLGVDSVSRSAMGRHVKQLDAIGAEIRRNRALAEAVIKKYGEESDSRVNRMNIELMHGVLTKLMFGEDGEQVKLDPKEAMFAATAIEKLGKAEKTDIDREKARRDLRDRIEAGLKKLEATLDDDAEDGTAAPTIRNVLAEIRQQIYGIG